MANRSSTKRSRSEPKSDPGVSYNDFKEFEGQRYTGMKIGRSHKWYYDRGEWKEKKVTPDLWQIEYAVRKRRAGKAPEGSGVPVGTEYHWYILAHQNVAKLNANDYSTSMTGLKFKVAHKRADKETWSASARAQRKRLIKFMEEVLEDLRRQASEEAGKPLHPEKIAAKNDRTKAATERRARNARKSKNGAKVLAA